MNDLKVIAVTVTYNRKDLLLECVESLSSQSYKLDNIIIIDNNSTDGTYEALSENGYIDNEQVLYKKLKENIGGAGGFYEGMKLAREMNADWIWIMDDDTIPKKDSLEELIVALSNINEKVSFLASSVYGMNNECMNVPKINLEESENGYVEWYRYLEEGMVEIEYATFVSLLINGEALKKIGLPCKEYFIWGDDSEYTLRLTKYFGKAFMVGASKVVHKRKSGKRLILKDEEEIKRINMYYYKIRNNYINIKTYDKKIDLIKYILLSHYQIFEILFSNAKYKMLKIKIILKGLYSAIFKRYDCKKFENRFDT